MNWTTALIVVTTLIIAIMYAMLVADSRSTTSQSNKSGNHVKHGKGVKSV